MNFNPFTFHSHGKLLLTGEYFVLDGARALALPTRLGQSLQVIENESSEISWTSYDADGSVWFYAPSISPQGGGFPQDETTVRLIQIFQAIEQQKPNFFQQFKGLQIETRLDFPRQWGLGTSSTLIANLAQWVEIDPFKLLKDTFGGSGYDVAGAMAQGPILYQLIDNQSIYKPALFQPVFSNQLYFIYLDKKQDSRQGIAHYREKVQSVQTFKRLISELTQQFVNCKNLVEFEHLIQQHEAIISETLELPRAKDLHFPDYWGEVKSLGAWGGDFVLATSSRGEAETRKYFNERGFAVVLKYEYLIL